MTCASLAIPGGIIEFQGAAAELSAVSALWAGLGDEEAPGAHRLVVRIERVEHGYWMEPPGLAYATIGDVRVACDDLVREQFLAWNQDVTHVHAACVIAGETTFLLAGSSGAGKSSLSHAAVRDGAAYWSDEYSVVSEAGIYGLPRTIQYDARPIGTAAPATGCDAETYAFTDIHGQSVVRPLAKVPSAVLAKHYGSLARVVLVFPRVGDHTEARPARGEEALPALLAQVTHGPFLDVQPLLQRATWLTWHDAAQAWELLRNLP